MEPLSPRVFRGARALRSRGVVLALSLGLCFVLSYLALRAGLAPIVGAFAAGLVLEEVHFALLVPVVFIRMGMLVDLRSFASASVLAFALLLTAAAILGKLACGRVAPRGTAALTIGRGFARRILRPRADVRRGVRHQVVCLTV